MSSNDEKKPPKATKTVMRGDQRPPPPSRQWFDRPRTSQNSPSGYIVPPLYKGPTPPARSVLKAFKTAAKSNGTTLAAAKSASGRQSSGNTMFQPRMSSSNTSGWGANSASSSQGVRGNGEVVLPPIPRNTKSTVELKPLWQQLDDEHEQAVLRSQKRDRGGNAITFSRRIGQRNPAGGAAAEDVNMADTNRDYAEIAPALKLRVNGEMQYSSSDEDEPRYKPSRKTIAYKAARKLEYVNASASESDESSEGEKSESSSSSSEEEQPEQPPSPKSDSDVEMDSPVPPIGDIVLLDYPRRASPTPEPQTEPPSELIAAVEALTLSVIRMQKTKQLPFLVRNVRQGFMKRCRTLQVPVFTDGRKVSLELVYEYIAGARYQTLIDAWCCPLCDLLGAVKTQEMLECHLRWDHAEVFCEWQKKGDSKKIEYWELRLLIPEIQKEEEIGPPNIEEFTPGTTETPHKRAASAFVTPHTRRLMSPFPSVSLSPPTPKPEPKEYDPLHLLPKIEFKLEPTPSTVPPPSRSPSSTLTLSSATPSTVSRSVSATSATRTDSRSATSRTHTSTSVASSSAVTASVQRQVGPGAGERPITPPPADNPLGPAAQYPYLPAKSDYGGPTVEYSCRPTGPSVFDLLGTLPMEQFGLLDWDIIDREEEIWEDDKVKPEYKVIQALWTRWIILNRNKFIANYYKGVTTFVNEYWKIIHRAAGWDALRYWLFILLANRYLDARDMARVLRHYEELTGMDNWYD